VFDGRLLATERGQSSKPKHAGTKVSLSRRMIEEQPRLARHLPNIKGILHEQEHIHIVRVGLCGNE